MGNPSGRVLSHGAKTTSIRCLPAFVLVFFFNDAATTEIYTLSLHDALPIFVAAFPARCEVEANEAVGLRGGGERLGCETVEERAVDLRQVEPCSRVREAREMLVHPEGPAAVDARRLERRTPAEKTLVVGEDDRLVRVDDTASRNCERDQQARDASSAGTVEPIAVSSGAAFVHDSSISSSGSESQTMPPPTQRWMRPSATAKVRIVSASSRSPFGQTVP